MGLTQQVEGYECLSGRLVTILAILLCVSWASPCDQVRATSLEGIIFPYVGGGNGDGGSATNAIIDPRGLVAVPQGRAGTTDLYIADALNNRVRHYSGSSGLIETLAGTGEKGYGGDGGPAESALLQSPLDVAVDTSGNVFIADTFNNRVRYVDPDGVIRALAGNGSFSFSGDDGPATKAGIAFPYGLEVASSGEVFIADFGNNRVRQVNTAGIIDTVAGSGQWGYGGDGGPATAAKLASPADIAIDASGNLYIADSGNHVIRRVDRAGIITTVVGTGWSGYSGDGGPPARASLYAPIRLAFDQEGILYIAERGNSVVRGVDFSANRIWTVAGNGEWGTAGDGDTATEAELYPPWGVATSVYGDVFVSATTQTSARSPENRVRLVDPEGIIHSLIGGGLGDGGASVNALVNPRGADFKDVRGGSSYLFFADGVNHRVRVVDLDTDIVETVAGTGNVGYSGDGGPATEADLNSPMDVTVDSAGNLFVADAFNNVVRRIGTDGKIMTVAGTGAYGCRGDGGLATKASLATPFGVAVDDAQNLYIAEFDSNRVRRVSASGIITTFAGNGAFGFSGDGGLATAATLSNPTDVLIAGDGTVYIADFTNNVVRRVNQNGVISTIAGNGLAGFSGDGGPATGARLNRPMRLARDGADNLFIADKNNNRVRWVEAESGRIYSLAGDGSGGDDGDFGPALLASVEAPSGLAVNSSGSLLFVSQPEYGRMRLVALDPLPGNTPPPTQTPTTTNSPLPTTTNSPLPTTTNSPLPTTTNSPLPTPTTGPVIIAGSLQYYRNGWPISDATVQAIGPNSPTTTTGITGGYSLSVTDGNDWLIQPSKTGGFNSGISALDAAYVLQAEVNKIELDDFQEIACDATGNGSISALDAARILQFVVRKLDSLPAAERCGSDWVFFPNPEWAPNQELTYPEMTLASCQQGAVQYSPLVGSADGQDFYGVLLGDCTGNWQPAGGGAASAVSMRSFAEPDEAVARLGRMRRGRGKRVRLPVYVRGTGSFSALDVVLAYDPTKLAPVAVRQRRGENSALVGFNVNNPGQLAIALASGDPITPRRGPVLHVEFKALDPRAARSAVMPLRVSIDDQPVNRVRVTR